MGGAARRYEGGVGLFVAYIMLNEASECVLWYGVYCTA